VLGIYKKSVLWDAVLVCSSFILRMGGLACQVSQVSGLKDEDEMHFLTYELYNFVSNGEGTKFTLRLQNMVIIAHI
jgi:hypothetical protein